MKITKFQNIPKFPYCSYRVDVGWDYLETHIKDSIASDGLILDPDFQRGHVWTERQQQLYCEYILRNGKSGKELYFNHPGWNRSYVGDYVIVDGKQRLEAVRKFLRSELKVFGSYRNEYTDSIDMLVARFSWNIAAIPTRKEVLEWYIDFNSGGTDHTEQEINRIKKLIMLEES